MIDVIINEAGSVTLAHTLKALDGYDSLEIKVADGSATLTGTSGRRSIGTLRPAMLEVLRPGLPGQSIRVKGWTIARVSPLTVRMH